MIISITNGGITQSIQVPDNADLGYIRNNCQEQLEDIGAPSSYSFAVNNAGQDDSYRLQAADVVSFRPVTGNKGAKGSKGGKGKGGKGCKGSC